MDIQDEYDVFMDCIEPAVLVPDGTVIVAMDLQDKEEETFVQIVRDEGVPLTVAQMCLLCQKPMLMWANGGLAQRSLR